MMNRKDFFEYVKENVQDYLPDSFAGASIRLEEVAKENGLTLTALVIPEEGKALTPTVYLDSFYQEYQNGKPLDACVGDVADKRIEFADHEMDVNINGILDYDYVKDKLQVRICEPEMNQERLEGKVVTMHGDFAAYYTVNLTENEDGIASVPVTDHLLDTWGVDKEQLHKDAMAADQHRGVVLFSMDEMMEAMVFGGEGPSNLLEGKKDINAFSQPMFCLTNDLKQNGASLIIQEDIRKQVGEFMKGDFFILPSSIHETLILPDNGAFDVHELNAMVKEINATQVDLSDRLSDKVQFCDGKTAVMENAQKRVLRKQQEKETAAEKGGLHGKLEKAKAQIKSENHVGKSQSKSKDVAMVM